MKYNDAIKERHENFRNDTVSQIEQAIETIKAFEGENAVITAKKILDNSSLSRSVLYKKHSLKIWNLTLWNERYGDDKEIRKKLEKEFEGEVQSFQEEIVLLKKKILNLEKQNVLLEEKLSNEQKRSEVYKMDVDDMKFKHQKLLAECQKLQNKLFAHGISE